MGEGQAEKKWNGKTGGTPFMQVSLMKLYKIVGLRPMYAVLALVVPFYMLFAHKGYIVTYRFFRRRMGYGRMKSFVNVYRNHFVFGQVIIDRFAAYSGMKFKLNMDGYDKFLSYADQPEGFIMLSSHVGNYEMAGYTLVSEKKTFNALVYGGETEMVMGNRQRMLYGNNINLIPVTDDFSHLFKINSALANGEILSIAGDRFFESSKTFECDLLGSPARFVAGPFALAVMREVKILAVFVMKDKWNSYNVHIREIKADASLPSKQRMQMLARNFASELEAVVRKYPTQWFNYYDFWETSDN